MAPDPEREQWSRLVEALDSWTAAREIAEDRFRVWLPEEAPSELEYVDVVMSPDDWDTWSSTVTGSFEDALDDVKHSVAQHSSSEPFLVFETYELVPSMTVVVPPDPAEERLKQWMRDNPGRPAGTWVAIGRDGRSYPFPEGPPR